SGLLFHQLRYPGRGRHVLGTPFGRRRDVAVRVAERPMGPLMAGCAEGLDTADGRPESGEVESRARRDAQDEENRHRPIAAGIRQGRGGPGFEIIELPGESPSWLNQLGLPTV